MYNVFGSEVHYCDHLYSVYKRLGPYQGIAWQRGRVVRDGFRPVGFSQPDFYKWARQQDTREPFIVASYQDVTNLYQAGFRNLIMMEHGIGQTYANNTDGSYISQVRSRYCTSFWMPNRRAAELQAAVATVPVFHIDSYRVQDLQAWRNGSPIANTSNKPVVAVSFHGNLYGCPEQQATSDDWWANGTLHLLAKQTDFDLVGHAHPRAAKDLADMWNQIGVPFVDSFEDVVRMADIYITDNSSTLYEAAACDIPVIVLNGVRYRPGVRHGLRFWNYADVGVQVWAKNDGAAQKVLETIRKIFLEGDSREARRQQIVAELFTGGEAVLDIIQKIETKTTEASTVSNQIIYARALSNQNLSLEGVLKAGQIFQPGWKHVQAGGKAVPIAQAHARPLARRNQLESSKICIPVSADEVHFLNGLEDPHQVQPAAVDVRTIQIKPVSSEDGQKVTDSDLRPVQDVSGSESADSSGRPGAHASEQHEVGSATDTEVPSGVPDSGQVLQQPVHRSRDKGRTGDSRGRSGVAPKNDR